MPLEEEIYSFYTAQKEKKNHLPSYIKELKDKSTAVFQHRGFPTTKQEDWKYTSLNTLLKENYLFEKIQEAREKDIDSQQIKNLDTYKIVFIDGIYNAELSDFPKKEKIIIRPFKEAFRLGGEVERILKNNFGALPPYEKDSLCALNNALFEEGIFIYLSKNAFLDKPIEINYLSRAKNPHFLSPRSFIYLEEGAELKIIESHKNFENTATWSNFVSEVHLEKGSSLAYNKIQNNRQKTALTDFTFVSQEEKSSAFVNTFSLGGKFIRNSLNFYQKGQQVESYLNGLTLSNEEQLVDHHTLVDHQSPNCQSHQLYKGIFGGNSKGVFNGKIFVDKLAQKINAFQQSNNIVLSAEASINAKPQLEIFADDVKCSHGCTVGQIDKQALFYLKSRGIEESQAKSLLLRVFLQEMLSKVELSAVSELILMEVEKKLALAN